MPETAGKRFRINAAFAAIFFLLGIASALFFTQFRTGRTLPAVEVAAAATPAPIPAKGEVSGLHSKVRYDGIDSKWAPAYANICDAVFQGYIDIFGYTLPGTLSVSISVTGEPTKGVYVAYDTSSGNAHSYVGSVTSKNLSEYGGEWMIKAMVQ